jgi:hypothetical protein
MQILATIIVLTLVIGLYIGSYVLNKRTPVPEGIVMIEGCDSCSTASCGHHPSNVKDEIKEHLSKSDHNFDCDI